MKRESATAAGKMFECATRRRFRKPDGSTEFEWVSRSVKAIDKGSDIRCAHCEGEVRIHRQRLPDGAPDHVKHTSADDARHCKGSGNFGPDDVHRMSTKPVR
jgi:hypothetical protein